MAGLSPWPTVAASVSRAAAVALLKGATNISSDDVANRLGSVASALVEDYAPGAPQALKDEAVIRFAGYLFDAGPDGGFGALPESKIGPVDQAFTTTHQNAWRNSGAGLLLTRFKVRRGGSIG